MGGAADIEAGFRRLHEQVRALGLDRRPTVPLLLELALHLTLALGGIALYLAADDLWLCALGMLVSTAGSMGVGTNSHTASHGAASRHRWVNHLLFYFGSPFFFGVSATYWWHKHLAGHHAAPNVVGRDPDIDFFPWFALNQEEVARTGALSRFYHRRLQWLLFLPAVALNHFNMQKDGWRHVLAHLANGRRRALRHWADLGALLLHLTVCIGLPLAYFPAADVLGFTVLRWALFGYAMFAVLAPAHWPAAATFRSAAGARGFVRRQLDATLNFRAGPLAVLCSGLDLQIEHHLFPTLSHVHYRRLRPLVQEFCARHGLPYRTLSWGEALIGALGVLCRPKPVLRDA